ncbi:hypothetical protein PCC6912_49970 [Chlorogloeopsis fritschii PCC 6912]|uniref:Nucleotidyl transferase domain-containing protein n=1 Tax=Chlorogloeopsis fritschii PCC 6912 TaxID=211165 RepID=A0A433N1K8_CHLFR|nr:hypothetical protein PCC6912_49970 [Chlorogloeopsis fritschii PCC 6912]
MSKDSQIHRSVLGIRTRIEAGCTIEDTLIMGADHYQTHPNQRSGVEVGSVPIGIGANTIIRRAIVDKNARIGSNVKLINKQEIEEAFMMITTTDKHR